MSAAAAPIRVGSLGRAAESRSRLPRVQLAPPRSDHSSFCITCASWYFGQRISHCRKCEAHIFHWFIEADLRLFRSRSSLDGF